MGTRDSLTNRKGAASDVPGTVEEDKPADLVLLEANPLKDITNTRKIADVILTENFLPKLSYKRC